MLGRMLKFDWLKNMMSKGPKVKKAPTRPTGRPMQTWTFWVPTERGNQQLDVKALTKSEARAEAKRQLRLDRLPPGTCCRPKG